MAAFWVKNNPEVKRLQQALRIACVCFQCLVPCLCQKPLCIMMSLGVLSVVSFTGCSTAESWGIEVLPGSFAVGMSKKIVFLMQGYQKELSSTKKEEKMEVKYPGR